MSIPFATGHTVTRFGAGSHINGVWSEGTSSTLTVQAVIQPAPGKELLLLEEAARSRDARVCFAESALYTVRESEGKRADRVTVDGALFEVHKVEPWNQAGFGVGHWKVLLLRVNE